MVLIDFVYVIKFDPDKIENALKRFECSLSSIYNQKANVIIFNGSSIDIEKQIKSKFPNITYEHKNILGKFNKPKMINYIVKKYVKTQYFICSDIDLVYENTYVERIQKFISNNSVCRVIPYNYNIQQEKYSHDINELKKLIAPNNLGGFAHGNGLIHLDSFNKVRGYDEDFEGYGPEDDEFNQRLKNINNNLIYTKDLTTCHIWHPPSWLIDRNLSYHNDMIYQEKLKQKRVISNTETWGTL